MGDEIKSVVFLSPGICNNAACAPNLPWSAIQTTHFHVVCERCKSEAYWDKAQFSEPPPCSACAERQKIRDTALAEVVDVLAWVGRRFKGRDGAREAIDTIVFELTAMRRGT